MQQCGSQLSDLRPGRTSATPQILFTMFSLKELPQPEPERLDRPHSAGSRRFNLGCLATSGRLATFLMRRAYVWKLLQDVGVGLEP